MMTTAEIRQAFLEYFRQKGHEVVASSSLVPGNDPTLLFTNAGMVQFKDLFLGREQRGYQRAASSQRCVRAGGKHNDLENVGYTARHHTFFEMLGNFSFGDYFKTDAIAYAWEFLTSSDWLNLPKERLWVTVYASDDEAYAIWSQQMGVPVERIIRIGDNKGAQYASDNFWQMGDTGPCGPCTEIFYDHGPEIAGGPPGSPDEDGDRYIEIWNVVFMQFERSADGRMTALPKPSVDTGMGLERISAVMQHVHSNYQIDLFDALLKAVAVETGVAQIGASHRVIADHLRSSSFLILDGVVPSNEGRGYVLRRIIRRALRHGHKLGCTRLFFHALVPALVSQMADAYPELQAASAQIQQTLAREEEQFARTLDMGMKILEDEISRLTGSELPGELIFKLYDTYGFPEDLTADIARERQLSLDKAGFDAAMAQQKQRARAASQFAQSDLSRLRYEGAFEFSGYQHLSQQARISALYIGDQSVTELNAGERGVVVLEQSPFYAESGGQVGDSGSLLADNVCFDVEDCQKLMQSHAHIGSLQTGTLQVGQWVQAVVDLERRTQIRLNHSATHLLHAALRELLGTQVQQKGSLVAPDRLRFDFSYGKPVSPAELALLEQRVNQQIRQDHQVQTQLMSPQQATQAGAMALFGEKYGDEVRVLSMGEFSMELCGGTHVDSTGQIGLFKIVLEAGIASGVRRIEAVTGEAALHYIQQQQQQLQQTAALLKADAAGLVSKVEQLLDKNRRQEKELEQLKARLAANASSELLAALRPVQGIQLLVTQVEGDAQSLRTLMESLRSRVDNAVLVLASVDAGRVNLIVSVTKNLTAQIKAGELVGYLAPMLGGKGGGRPDFAQAGGTEPAKLPDALAKVESWLIERL